jgi:phosphatidylserine/phosphatidylglycerophosphate/cardiolipin synthase-like enzyme
MTSIKNATAICNNEVAILGWDLDDWSVDGLLGFHIVRQLQDDAGEFVDDRPLASYVGFTDQSNPGWLPQNTSVWPIQKFFWRDLTLRQQGDGLERLPSGQRVRYAIAAVGALKAGMTPVDVVETPGSSYDGDPLPLGYLTQRAVTNAVTVTAQLPPFTATFTKGVLSTQFLLHLLGEPDQDGNLEFPSGAITDRLTEPGDPLRETLSGDVLTLIRDFFGQEGGRFHAALYELDDKELLALLMTNADRVDLILSDAGGDGPYDTRNAFAREELRKEEEHSGLTKQNRMFNGSGHIGHNKFVVHVDRHGHPDSVLTGSTNWTWSGVAGQSNNCIRIDDAHVAKAFYSYWKRLQLDVIPDPDPLSDPNDVVQSDALKAANGTPAQTTLADGTSIETWWSPNVVGKKQPPASSPAAVDLDRLFALMQQAQEAIFFLVFLPSIGGKNSVVSEALTQGLADGGPMVIGAISDGQAMWQDPNVPKSASAPHVLQHGAVSVVRATALSDKAIVQPIGDFQLGERLAAEHAIIHDKIVVLDPLDPVRCVVAFGSHNLGYKASYANDENLTIVRGNRPLAEAYAAHVIDVYDHYRFRAKQAEPGPDKPWDGRLHRDPEWQDHASRYLSRYLCGRVDA